MTAGAWFANKIIGPSADELGTELRHYSSERWSKIFRRTEELAGDAPVSPINPAIAYTALREASLSDDSDEITDMWARLFIDAATNKNKPHRLFVDILSHLKSDEARYIESLVSLFMNDMFKVNRRFLQDYRAMIKEEIERLLERGVSDNSAASIVQKISDYRGEEIGWPSDIVSFDGKLTLTTGTQRFRGGNGLSVSLDTLIRERILDLVDVHIIKEKEGVLLSAQVVALTSLGLEFVIACRGIKE